MNVSRFIFAVSIIENWLLLCFFVLLFGKKSPIHVNMNGSEFIKKIKKLGKQRGVSVRFTVNRGKGSHGTLYYGAAFTVVKDRKKELPTGTFRDMLSHLGLAPKDI
ncbi:MAG: type II toxin-antitoxin system HicA family toxin [Desulfobacteraceae bacterium]